MDDKTVTELTADIVGAYVANNRMAGQDVAGVIALVADALRTVEQPAEEAKSAQVKLTPAQIRRSITPEAITSFIDGRPYRLLKRHLSQHGYTPDTYRKAFGLPADYPMTAPDYAAKRSAMAKALGLGVTTRGSAAPPPTNSPRP